MPLFGFLKYYMDRMHDAKVRCVARIGVVLILQLRLILSPSASFRALAYLIIGLCCLQLDRAVICRSSLALAKYVVCCSRHID